jgi:DNA-binding winged helix-turn-helix (wHTH) protein
MVSGSAQFPPFHLPSHVDVLYCNRVAVALEPQAVRVLRYLIERRQRVVSKEELLEKLWPDTFTTDDVLKKPVSQARRA